MFESSGAAVDDVAKVDGGVVENVGEYDGDEKIDDGAALVGLAE